VNGSRLRHTPCDNPGWSIHWPAVGALLAAALAASGALAQFVAIDLGTLEGNGWQAERVRVAFVAGGGARVDIGAFAGFGQKLAAVRLECARFAALRGVWRCDDGVLQGPEKLAVSFAYTPAQRSLVLALATTDGESWQLEQAGDAFTLKLARAQLVRVTPWLPGTIKPSAGRLSGMLHMAPGGFNAELAFEGAAFADASGLTAGENLAGTLALEARQDGGAWRWNTRLKWDTGALLIDPVYVAEAGHQLTAAGSLKDTHLEIDSARLDWRALGRIDGKAGIDTATWALRHWAIESSELDLADMRALLPQTWLEQHGLADLSLRGRARLAASARAGAAGMESVRIGLKEAKLDAPARRIGVDGIDLDFEYRTGGATPFRLDIAQARLKGLELGPVSARGEVRDERLAIANLIIPLLDGVLALNEIEIGRLAGRWRAQLRGAFTPLSMQRLTAALDWHPMSGSISAVLPQMNYVESASGSTFSVDGALLFKVFGGDASVDGIRIDNPFGRTPRLAANLKLSGLDLETMTGAVKFGSITGRIDINLENLEMENWQPLSFDAHIATSPGDFRKRISQRAVQNISAIGGAGAGAAIQASFMRFFDTFGYERLGLSCRLRNGVCEMGGIDRAGGGYTIVKGGGLPALNVVGYNRFVGWQEMLDRIQAVIEGNSKMVVQ